MKAFNLPIRRTVKKGDTLPDGKKATDNIRVDVGTVTVHTPLVDEIIQVLAPAKQAVQTDDKGNVITQEVDGKQVPVMAVDDDGLPVLDSDGANWLFSAIVAAVKAGARNKLVKDSVQVKDGLKIPETLAELFEPGTRGAGAALAAMRDCRNAFAEFVATLNKSESTSTMMITLFNNKQALALQSDVMKGKMKGYVEEFVTAALTEEQVDTWGRTIEAVLETCKPEEKVTDLSDF